MKKDMEFSTGREFTSLPDEYLQGGGNGTQQKQRRKSPWKRMMYMIAAMSVVGYTAFGSSSGGNAKAAELPVYPVEDMTSFYTVYNDSYDPEQPGGNLILESGFLFESLLIQGMDYALPKYEPMDGFVFLGWVIDCGSAQAVPAGEALTASNICYVEPREGSRNIEVHAAWRHDGISEYPFLLTLDANAGTIEGENAVTYDAQTPMGSGSVIYLCAYPVPEREGYTFTGWYDSPGSNGKQTMVLWGMNFYAKKGDNVDFSTTDPITLYAGWEKNP